MSIRFSIVMTKLLISCPMFAGDGGAAQLKIGEGKVAWF